MCLKCRTFQQSHDVVQVETAVLSYHDEQDTFAVLDFGPGNSEACFLCHVRESSDCNSILDLCGVARAE